MSTCHENHVKAKKPEKKNKQNRTKQKQKTNSILD